MAVQLLGYLWLRNNELNFLIDLRNKNHNSVPRNFSDEDRSKLKEIIDKIDKLHEPLSDVYHDETLIEGEHVLVAKGLTKVIERSTNREESGKLFERIHNVLRKYGFSENRFKEIYYWFGKAFSEIGLTPTEEIQRAIVYAKNLRDNSMNSLDGSRSISWDDVLEPN